MTKLTIKRVFKQLSTLKKTQYCVKGKFHVELFQKNSFKFV